MSTAAKLAVSVTATLLLIFGVELAIVALMSDAGSLQIMKGIWLNFYLNNSFKGFLGFALLSAFIAFPIFDYLCIACFRFGWDKANNEVELYAEGTSQRISTEAKAKVMYPFFIVGVLIAIAAMTRDQKDTILKLGGLAQ